VQALKLGDSAAEVSTELQRRCGTRMAFRAMVDAWGNTQPAGQRLLHRACDVALDGLRSTSPLQTRYVPVGFMWFEGFSRLLAAGVQVPGMVVGDAQRLALEAYPAAVAQALIGGRSYKNGNEPERLIARKDIIEALEQGRWRGLRLRLSHAQRDALVADAQGDQLDAAMCLMQAAWASTQPRYGLPAAFDALEGWIVGA
jgi:hypothetical protein